MHPCVGCSRQLLFLRRVPVRYARTVRGNFRTFEHSYPFLLAVGIRRTPLWMVVHDSPIFTLKRSDVHSSDIRTPDSTFSCVVNLTERMMHAPQLNPLMIHVLQRQTSIQIVDFVIAFCQEQTVDGATNGKLMLADGVPLNWRSSFAPRPRRLAWAA